MTAEPEDQQRVEEPLCLMQAEDDDSSETSEDDDDQIKTLYSKLPEDLGFTLVGMDFGQSDFKTLKKLKMDLDTFLTLSEKELTDFGLKESAKLQASISKISSNEIHPAHKTLFWKPRVKDIRISSEDALMILSNIFSQIQELRQFLEELQFTLSATPPVNYMLTKKHSYRDVFRNAMTRALVLSKCVSLELHNLLKKFEEESEKRLKKISEKNKKNNSRPTTADKKGVAENEVNTDAKVLIGKEHEKGVAVDAKEEKDGQTEVNVVGKLQSPSYYNIRKRAIAATSSGALLLALWALRKFVSSQRNFI